MHGAVLDIYKRIHRPINDSDRNYWKAISGR